MDNVDQNLANVLVELLEGSDALMVQEVMRAFVRLLAERQELYRVNGVSQALESVWRDRYGAATIAISTAYPLTDEMRASLQALAQGATIHEEVDATLIGGARLKVDDTIIDGSVKGHLETLKQALLNA